MDLYLKQKVFSIGEKFNFYDRNQNIVYRAEGSFFSIPKYFTLYINNRPSLRIEKRFFTFMPQYKLIDLPSGTELGTIKKRFSFFPNFDIETANGYLTTDGSLFGYNFKLINSGGQIVTEIDKHFLSWGDTYEVSIDDKLIWPKIACGIIIAFDNAIHNENNNNNY